LGSGSLGLISIPGRSTVSPAKDRVPVPRLIRLSTHPRSSVLVRLRAALRSCSAIRQPRPHTGEVVGEDPLEPFGARW
jgi:hypothetical protein